ncbi:MAG TPA: glycoside hydrolase family 18 protein [bacterium]|nr:glycoside hydrolase family 18 protein [bacterium]
MIPKAWAAPPYQVVCYALQDTKSSTSSLTGSAGAINWNSDVPWGDLTVIADAFYQPNANKTFTNVGAKGNTLITAAHSHGVRCIVSLGGAGQDGAFATLCSSANRAAFASAVSNLVATNGYDGVDIDWETPGAAPQADATAMMQLIYQDIKALPNSTFDNQPRTVSFATVDYVRDIYNMTTLGSYTDWCFYMGYDWYDCPNKYNGPLNLIKNGIAAMTNGSHWAYPLSKMVLGCPLYTNDYDGGCGAQEYQTLSTLHLGTAGAYNATYAEQSYTANGHQVYVDTAQSYCDKINWAVGSGLRGIGMWDLGQGLPYTDSLMSPIWDVIGGNSACLTVVGSTPTPTRTASMTPTASLTATPSATPTRTSTATATATNSATRTNTSTETATSTFTRTASMTPTASLTATPSATPTRTFTATSTNTAANTSTHTATATATRTNTSTGTATATFTRTVSMTPSASLTASPSATPTRTFTATSTNTATNTATSTVTSTPTVTSTSTNTSVITPTPTDSMTPTASLTASPSATPTRTFTGTSTVTSTPTMTSTPTLSPTATASSTSTRTATDSMTATPSLTASPSASPTHTPMQPTNTFTSTATPTATSTFTLTRTSTPSSTPTTTSTPTHTFTRTFTPTATRTSTATATSTPTPNGNGRPVVYPNPAPGPTVNLLPPPYPGIGTVEVDVFTGAFRMAAHWEFANVPSGVSVVVPLTDGRGSPLANGIYYLRVRTPAGHFLTKLLVLR